MTLTTTREAPTAVAPPERTFGGRGRGWARCALLALALTAVTALSAACRPPSPEEKQAVARGIDPVRGAPEVPWDLVFERDVGGNSDLFLIPARGGTERRLTEAPGWDGHARWMPDGERLIFTSDRTGTPQLWELSVSGGRPRRLRTNDATEYQSDPSPDGTKLAFLSNLGGPERLMVVDFATGTDTELVRHGEATIFGNPHWSPDGSRIVFSSNWRIGHQIYVVNVATRHVVRISGVTSGGCEPRFTRDGRRVSYVSRGHMRPTSQLVEKGLESGEETVLVDWPALNYDLAYSPDGTEIAFASNITGSFAIYRQRLSDGKAWRVTFGEGDARYPEYRPRPGDAAR